ncbi:MAG TPA: lamin tail domain-containing protein, partial [Blastocatellia bacterium]|nr:lamin tail domain-containing protein [Blastocatellia bacterium]
MPPKMTSREDSPYRFQSQINKKSNGSPSRMRATSLTAFFLAVFAATSYYLAFPPVSRGVSTGIVIGEFRVRGPNGGSDEFVELYNLSSSPINIGGWKIRGSNNAGTIGDRLTITAGTILNAGCHYLVTNSSTSGGPYSGAVPGNQTYATGITDDGGIAVTLPDNTIVDQVGLSAGSAFKEGTPLASLGSSNLNRGYERKPGGASGSGTDTDNNATDFQLITPSDPQNLSSTCIGATTNPSGVGSASPGTVPAGGSSLLTVTVTPGTNPTSTGINVTGDLSPIGGSNTQQFFDNGTNGDVTPGDNVFSFQATIPLATSAGLKNLPVSITDAQARTGNTTIALNVSSASTNPSGAGSANPPAVSAGASTLLTVGVTPGTNPTSSGLVATGNLTSIGGSTTQQFFDDGTNGDVAAGDNTFTFLVTVALGTTTGVKTLPITITDAELRTGTTNISLTVNPPLVAIHDIQGSGNTSPLTGQVVATTGIVTGSRTNGFFLQTPDISVDADSNTSEGIFVFTGSAPPAAATIGNSVSVTGTVQEFKPSTDPNSPTATELGLSPVVTLLSSGNPLPVPITLTAADTNPAGPLEVLERFEGMRVHVDSLTVVAPTEGFVSEPNATSTSNGIFFGVITGVARPFREPGIERPDPPPAGSPA